MPLDPPLPFARLGARSCRLDVRYEPTTSLLRTAINTARFGFPGSSQGKTVHEHVEHGGEQESNTHHAEHAEEHYCRQWPNLATASPTPLAAG
jgi:hypothetical protein